MTLIDGKAISEQVKQEIATEVAEIVARGGKRPHLAAILVGHDGGSETYVAAKVKACEACGFKSSLIRYETDVTEEELLAKVRELNEDADVDGFIVQLPLPKHINVNNLYRRQTSGTVALVQSNKLEALAAAVKNVVTAVGNKQVDLTAIQGYEGLNPHLFYDLEQYIEALTNDTDAFKAALKEAVIFTDHTPQFYSAYSQQPIGLPRSCGLSCFIDSNLFHNS